jgi:hypothetical protein
VIDDRNKTELTKLVTAAAFRYLDERGFKPVETEVPVCDGWVADLAGVISPTQTELQELKLLPPKPGWKKPQADREAWCALANKTQALMTALVEVKTSCSDFRGDKKWTSGLPTNLAYLAIPNDLAIGAEEIPGGWGVLQYSVSSDCLRITRPPSIRQVSTALQLDVLHEIAVRRDHHTRYERERSFRKEAIVHRNEDVSRTRMSTAIRAVAAVINGHSMGGIAKHGSIKEALEYHGIKHVFHCDMELLEKLWTAPAEQPRSMTDGGVGTQNQVSPEHDCNK